MEESDNYNECSYEGRETKGGENEVTREINNKNKSKKGDREKKRGSKEKKREDK